MRIIGCYFLIGMLITNSCSLSSNQPVTDLDVATHFIRAIQRNKFRDARKLMLNNETNLQYLDRFETHFHTKPAKELQQLREAEIIVNEVSNVSDSVTVINYSNSFNKVEKNKLKLVRVNGQWLVDLQYTFSGNL